VARGADSSPVTLVHHAAPFHNVESVNNVAAPGGGTRNVKGSRGRYHVEIANETDEAELRSLMRTTPMTGPIQVTLRREPNFFDAASVEGPFHQVLIARETSTRRIVGMGSRSVRLRWVDGHPRPVGYLGGLRLLPEARHKTLLMRGYRELARLHGDGRADFYLTTIAEGNRPAMSALTGMRAGLPAYHDLGRYFTFVLPLHRRKVVRADPELHIRSLEQQDLPRFVEFLNTWGRDRLFFPCLAADDFGSGATTFRDLALDRVLCAWRGDQRVGALAAWDQSSFRQTVVERYTGIVRWWKPFHNLYAAARGLPRFPTPGSQLRNLTLALPIADDDSGTLILKLLAAIQHRHRSTTAADSLLLGLFERDPLLKAVRPLALHAYVTRVFVVTWDPANVRPERFNGRNLYLELGCL
jgi:hypothetical protein